MSSPQPAVGQQAPAVAFSSVSPVILDGLARIAPPRRISVADAAVQHVRVPSSSGSTEWSKTLAPYMVEPMNLLTSRRHEAVIFVGPARSGKTNALVDCWMAYAATCDPGDMILYFSSEANALDYAKRRLRRMHESSPALAEALSPRSDDNSLRTITYRSGAMVTLGWPTSSQMSQRDARYVGLSDFDSMPPDVDGEGSPFDLAKKRVQAMLSAGMAMVESSPKFAIASRDWRPDHPHDAPPTDGGILPIYQRGDRRRWYWQCIHCGAWFEAPALPDYDDLPDPEKAAATAHVVCKSCGGIHYPPDKRLLQLGGPHNRPGVWVPAGCTLDANGGLIGEGNRSAMASFWVLGCAAAFQQWHSLVRNYVHALRTLEKTGQENDLKASFNLDQGLAYLPRAMTSNRDPEKIMARAEEWPRREVPYGVRYLTAAVDVQGNRFVVQVLGWGEGGERWLIDRYNIRQSRRRGADAGDFDPINPAQYVEDWQLIVSSVVKRGYPLAYDGGRLLYPIGTAVDSGGKAGVTERAYHFWKQCRGAGLGGAVMLVKGGARPDAPRIIKSFPDSSRRADRKTISRGEVPVYILNTLILKDGIAADLDRPEPGPGYIHLPEWVGAWFFNELTAESRTAKGWESGGARNEAFDLMVYNSAVHLILGGDKIDWARPPAWADPLRAGVVTQSIQEVAPGRAAAPIRRAPTAPSGGWSL